MKKVIFILLSIIILIIGAFIYINKNESKNIVKEFFILYYEQYSFKDEFLGMLEREDFDGIKEHVNVYKYLTTPEFFYRMQGNNFWYPKDMLHSNCRC